MPLYRLQFVVESCLSYCADVTLRHRDTDVLLLFSKRQDKDRFLRVQTEIEAPNNRDAQSISGSRTTAVLDALSFTTGTSLLVKECELILKDESGDKRRRAIYIAHISTPINVPFDASVVPDTEKMLQAESLNISTCWLRYALHRELSMDQFVFNWLAFEVLAGDADVPSRCPKCRQQLEHCEEIVSHRGASKEKAAEIFCSANPETAIEQFNKAIWNEARNKVFHGRSYPSPAFLTNLNTFSKQIRKATSKEISRIAKVKEQEPRYRYEQMSRMISFVEWTTSDASQKFAIDWPEAALAEIPDEPVTRAFGVNAEARFANYRKDSPDW